MDLAVTPGDVVLRTEVFELIRYAPQTETVSAIPLLIVPPMINKFYAMDLAPGRSLVEYLVGEGKQVFMMSWRNPDARHADWGLDAYGQAILDALDASSAHRRRTRPPARALLGRHRAGAGRRRSSPRGSGPARRVHPAGDGARPGAGGHRGRVRRPGARQAAIAVSAAKGYLDGKALAEIFAWLRPAT